MGKTLYLDCFAGISGDMTVGCLLDLGADEQKLRKALAGLHLEGYEIAISRVRKSGLDMCDFAVIPDAEHENHDHDMEYLHGSGHHHDEDMHHDRGYHHDEETLHNSGHNHDEETRHGSGHTHRHPHEHRGLLEITQMIQQAELSERAKKTALRIFDIIGEAEAKAHGVAKEEVHFHEVGAVDSIVDITAVAVCLDDLDITDVIVTSLCEGKGMVRCQHGLMPVPVPAVVNIVNSHQLTIQTTAVEGELITPTGAAIVAAIRTADTLPANYKIHSVGMGAGKRSYSRPSILRGMIIGKGAKDTEEEQIWKLESTIDDTAGEGLGYVMECLFAAGARDVHYVPVFMKKNRPAYLLTVICEAGQLKKMEQIIFENTTSIGIRKYPVMRSVLQRRIDTRKTSYGRIAVKECNMPDGSKRIYPEYESIRKICDEKNLPYWEVYHQLLREL